MKKFIGRQRLILTTGKQNSSRSHKSFVWAKQKTFFIKGKVRNLKLKLKKLILQRIADSYRISFWFSISKCQSLQKSIYYDGGSGHLCAMAVAMLCGSEVTAPTFQHLSVYSCPETIEEELGSFAPTLFNLILNTKDHFPIFRIIFFPFPFVSIKLNISIKLNKN